MYCLKRWIIWIYRWRHCRGFGVQSPSDYSFIRYVINEHYPYYAYYDLKTEIGDIGKLKRKKAELLFRIANWKQAPSAVVLIDDDVYAKYIRAGCRKTEIRNRYGDEETFMVVSALEIDGALFLQLLDKLRHGSLLVIDNLKIAKSRRIWDKIVSDKRATITFDLYYVGIVISVDNRYKQNYIVNF